LGYEHYDDIQSSSPAFASPTALEKNGDFSKSLNADGTLHIIYDPLTVINGARQPFPLNVITSNRLNPTGLAMALDIPAADFHACLLRGHRPRRSGPVAVPRRGIHA